jgi:hypothetical protein
VQQLLTVDPHLRAYLEKYVLGDLPRFARSFLSGIECLGYNTTSVAESMNNLLKNGLPNRSFTLKEMRVHLNYRLDEHTALQSIHQQQPRKIVTSFEFENQILLSKKIRANIAAEISKSDIQTADLSNDDGQSDNMQEQEKWKVININDTEQKNYFANSEFCECGMVIFQGIPCSHILTVRRIKEEAFPVHLISKRWVLESHLSPDVSVTVCEDFLDNNDGENIVEDSITSNTQNAELPPVLFERSERERYLSMFYLAKQLSALAARHIESTNRITINLQQLIQSCLTDDSNQDHLDPTIAYDVCDAIGHPPGRPKISKLKGMKRSSEKIIKQSQRCSKCGESGHNARSCKKQIENS